MGEFAVGAFKKVASDGGETLKAGGEITSRNSFLFRAFRGGWPAHRPGALSRWG